MKEGPLELAHIVSLGCPKNRVDSEYLAGVLMEGGVGITPDPRKADYIILNTCGFIRDAVSESVREIFDLLIYRETGRCRRFVVAGCLWDRYGESLRSELPEVDAFVGSSRIGEILNLIRGDGGMALKGEGGFLPGKGMARPLSYPPHSAYLKVSEGCSRKCTFCSIPLIKGGLRSAPLDQVIEDAGSLIMRGVREINIVSQDTISYGEDRGRRMLIDLVSGILELPGYFWLRLMYLYPDRIPDPLLEMMIGDKRFCRYIDLPLQHVSDRVLKRMKRGIGGGRTRRLIEGLKERVPGIAIRSTFMAGFPGEGEEEFRELIDFIERGGIRWGGGFLFSPEEGTPAFSMKGRVPAWKGRERLKILNETLERVRERENRKEVGEERILLVDEVKGGKVRGRLEIQAPEIDGEVKVDMVEGLALSEGSFVKVRITGSGSDYFTATPLEIL